MKPQCILIEYIKKDCVHRKFRVSESSVALKRGICARYSILTAALLRSLGIPTKLVAGSNHGWNESYVNNRWIIYDCTFDSYNKYENGVYSEAKKCGYHYFDMTIAEFSKDHLIEDTEDDIRKLLEAPITTPKPTKTPMTKRTITPKKNVSPTKTPMPTKVPKLTIKTKVKKLKVGKSKKFTVMKQNITKKVTWKSSNKKVATVSSTGKVKAKKKGRTKITASARGLKVSVWITVY